MLKNSIHVSICRIARKKFDPKKTILLSSHPRSGSRWLLERFLDDKDIISVWEPLHLNFGNRPKEINQSNRITVNNNNESQTFDYFQDLFTSLSNSNSWTLKLNSISRIIKGNRLVVKSVRSNLILDWLTDNFGFEFPPVVLIRHPVATCNSCKRNFAQNATIEKLLDNWCNYYSHSLKNPDKYFLVYYEDLKENFHERFEELKTKYELTVLKVDHKRPSSSDFQKSFNFSKKLFEPKEHYDDKELEKFQNILSKNGITEYDAFNPVPLFMIEKNQEVRPV